MKIIIYGVLLIILAILIFYVSTQVWYFFIFPMEFIPVKSIATENKEIGKACQILRVGGEYLIPVIAVSELFGLRARIEDDLITMTNEPGYHIQMKLFDTVAHVNQNQVMLRTPPILVEMPMVPTRLFEKLYNCKIKFKAKLSSDKSSGINEYLRGMLTSPLSILNFVAGVAYIVLWKSLGHIGHYEEREDKKWRFISRLAILFTIILYVAYVVTSRIERGYFY